MMMGSDILTKIEILNKDRMYIKEEIKKLRDKLEQNNFKNFLLELALGNPLITIANKKFKEYMHITQPVEIPSCDIKIYPVWVELECLYPPWSKCIRNTYFQSLTTYNETDLEYINYIIKKALSIDYITSKRINKQYDFKYYDPYNSDFVLDDNVKLNWEDYEIISNNCRYIKKRKYISFHKNLIDTKELYLCMAQVKLLLIIPLSILNKINIDYDLKRYNI